VLARDYLSILCLLSGLNITFIHIPGETPDQIGVWIPDRRVLLPADDIYTTFPNLYAIRGTPPRDTTLWFRSLDRMRSLGAEHLVPSHTRPVSGAAKIDELLRVYSAAIEFIHDQTVRMFNSRMSPDEIGEAIQLPPELAQHRYLQEFYGAVDWSARGVYERYIGWFSGDPVDLRPLGPRQRASRYVQLAGGETKILKLADQAIKAGDFQWALELATHAYRASGERSANGIVSGGRTWRAAREVKAKALRGLAGVERNPIARNYYLTALVQDHISAPITTAEKRRVVDEAPASLLFEIMKLRLVPDKVVGANWTIVFRFTDTEQVFVLRIVHCVLRFEETESYKGHFDATVSTTLKTWKAINVGEMNPLMAYLNGDLKVTGSRMTLLTFLRSIDRS
jgi:alkyl sulfatase BDS1-like metallo-beta-lactamase superfamily hydrolase